MVTAPLSTTPSLEGVVDHPVAETEDAPLRPRFDPFRVLSRDERERELRAYLDYLRETEGEIDFENWQLPVREEQMRQLRAQEIRWEGGIDVDAFYRIFHRLANPPTDAQTMWISLVARANESERYGVELESRLLRPKGRSVDPLMVYHVIQEQYHTLLLLEACRTVGLEGVTLLNPNLFFRAIMRAMSHFPHAVRYSLILVGECIGSIYLKLLEDEAALFGSQPEVAQKLRSILAGIVRDERLHAIHCRSRLGPKGLMLSRILLRLACPLVRRAYPEILHFGLDGRTLLARIHAGIEIPEGVDWVEPDSIPVRSLL